MSYKLIFEKGLIAVLAQLVERTPLNRMVVGSSPTHGIFLILSIMFLYKLIFYYIHLFQNVLVISS